MPRDVILSLNSKLKLNVDAVQFRTGIKGNYISQSYFAYQALGSGKSVILTIPPPSGQTIGHSISLKGAYLKNVVKVNGASSSRMAFKIYNPANSKPYFVSSGYINNNIKTVFSIWK